MSKYNIDTDLGLSITDESGWSSLWLSTQGDSLSELIQNIVLAVVDRHGGERYTMELDCVDEETARLVLSTIELALKEAA